MGKSAKTERQRLGDFEILGELGRGGMGIVYEARQVSLNRKVALKVLAGSLGITPTAVLRFKREAEAAAKLHHTNIVPVYGIGEQDGTHFYAMELIDGPSLNHVITHMRRTPSDDFPLPAGKSDGEATSAVEIPPWVGETLTYNPAQPAAAAERAGAQGAMAKRSAAMPKHAKSTKHEPTAAESTTGLTSGGNYFDTIARMIAEVADGLDYAHKNGVIHRDMKPSNLMLAPDGRVSINDFGLARMLEQPGMTMTGEFMGSPLYMSPEQMMAGRMPLDHRTDIYSLGATLYELLTLQPPFPGETRERIIAQIMTKEPVSLRKVNKRVPLDLETICLKALEKDPDRRYVTAGALADDLRRYVNRFAISARRAGVVGRTVKWVRRNRAVAALGACVLVVGLAAGLFAWRSHVADLRVTQMQLEQAKEAALLAAMSGDFNAADGQIAQAERFGASTGWVRLLRGQVAFHRADYDEAVKHLEQAVALMPESLAAFSMLAMSRRWGGDEDAYFSMIPPLRRMEPDRNNPFQGLLFKGLALSHAFSMEGLEELDRAITMEPASPVARLIRAQVRLSRAMETASLEVADGAIEDAVAALSFLPQNPKAITTHLMSYLVRANILKENGDTDGYHEAMVIAGVDAVELEMHPADPNARFGRAFYWELEGNFERARKAACGDGLDLTDDLSYLARNCARMWYLRREPEKARAAFDNSRGRAESYARFVVGYIDAETEVDRVALADRYMGDLRKRLETSTGLYLNLDWTALRLMGDSKHSVEVGVIYRDSWAKRIQALTSEPSQGWLAWMALAQYTAGELSAKDLIATCQDLRGALCLAHHVLGVDALGNGKRELAADHFRKVRDTNAIGYTAYRWSQVFLARLNEDPNWPSWILVRPAPATQPASAPATEARP